MPRRSKSAAKVAEEMENWEVAREMIARGARPPVALAATNLSRDALRDLYQNEHNKRPPCGQLRTNSLSYVRRLRHSAHATFFFRCYAAVGKKEIYSTVDPRTVIRAHDLYLKLVGETEEPVVDFTFAWFLARDIRSRIIERKYCPTCQIDYLYSIENENMHNCPCCRSYENQKSKVEKKAGA